MPEVEICWSSDEELFDTDFDSVAEGAWENLHPEQPETFTLYRGEVRRLCTRTFVPDSFRTIEHAQEVAYDEAGESAEGWLEGVSSEHRQLLENMIGTAFETWCEITGNKINFWTAEKVHPITVRRSADGSFQEEVK